MASDGSIIIDTRVNTDGFNQGTVNMKNQLGKLGGTIKKIGVAIGAAFAVKKLVDFGKEAIELGSDLQEVQNVVDVTFTTMSDKVDQFAKSAAQAAGLSETMAKRYVGTFGAMSKSFGFAEEDAYNMSTSLTQLSGDIASFYNITQDEAYTKLKSVFTGETESLKELGVVMTQSALDAYALANGFGKTTSAMTEQEKVALRYQFVMSQLSAASGDFIRTSDSWANQVRILKLQFESLKATIGQGLINLFTPVIKVINTLLAKLSTVASAFKSFTELITGKKSSSGSASSLASDYNDAATGAGNLASATEDAANATKDAAKAAKGYLSPLDEINKMSSPEEPGASVGGAVSSISGTSVDYGSLAEGETIVDKTTESFKTLLEMFAPLKEALDKYGGSIKETFSIIGNDFKDFGKQIGSATVEWFKNLDWKPLLASVDGLLKDLQPLINLILDGLGWAYEHVLLPFGKWTIEEGLPAAINLLGNAFEFLGSVLEFLQPIAEWLWENLLKDLGTVVGNVVTGIMDALSGLFEFLTGVFQGDWDKAFEGLKKTVESLNAIFDSVIGYIKDNILAPFDEWFSGVFSKDWTEQFGILGEAINMFLAIFKSAWDAVKIFLNGVITFLKGGFSGGWKQAWEGIKQILAGIFLSMLAVVKTPINGIIGMINMMVSAIVAGLNAAIDALNSIRIDIPDWVPFFGGDSFGINLGHITAPRIPYLAQGAVIPPNAPFMAVLGDQRNGNNLEMPESLLRRIVREETRGSAGGTYRFIGQINRRVLFDEMITEAKMRQAMNGQNPFEMA